MTKDDIIKLAREAGFLIDTHSQKYQPNCILSTHGLIDENLQRFANLAAAAEREQAEPPPEWLLIKNILDEYGLDAIAFVAEWKAAQRRWQGLTEQDMPSGEDPMFDHLYFIAGMVYADKVLKKKNT